MRDDVIKRFIQIIFFFILGINRVSFHFNLRLTGWASSSLEKCGRWSKHITYYIPVPVMWWTKHDTLYAYLHSWKMMKNMVYFVLSRARHNMYEFIHTKLTKNMDYFIYENVPSGPSLFVYIVSFMFMYQNDSFFTLASTFFFHIFIQGGKLNRVHSSRCSQ